MIVRTLQWNIGGAKIREADSDKVSEGSYVNDGLHYVVRTIADMGPDIVTLQEVHGNDVQNQAEYITDECGLKYVAYDSYDASHIEKGQRLGQAVISRFPIVSHDFSLFVNPKFEIDRPDGEHWISHDKGLTSCLLKIEDREIMVQTLHSVPFRKFGVDALGGEASAVRKDMVHKLDQSHGSYILQADFNYNEPSIKPFLTPLFDSGLNEVILSLPTTPKGRWYDHVLYRGVSHVKSYVMNEALTDHYPVYTEFSI